MGNGNRSGRRRRDGGRHRGRGKRSESGGDNRMPAVPLPQCPYCNKPIRDIYSAIAERESGEPAHFDCILKILREQESVRPDEKVCYLGKGSFGIIQTRPGGGKRFTVKKRIQYEESDREYTWRKQLDRVAERNQRG